MKSFEYAAPESVDEAAGLLSDSWGETEVLAGGTDLITVMKQNLVSPNRLVSLKNCKDLKSIQASGDNTRVGAMVTLAQLAENDAVKKNFPSLVQAVEGIGSRQMIAHGTVAGDLCQRPRCWYYRNGLGLLAMQDGKSLVAEGENRYHAIFGNDGPAKFVNPSSLAPALIALDAVIEIAGAGGNREVKAGEFFKTPQSEDERENVLKPNEVVTAIVIPNQGLKNGTYEVRHRHGLDWPLVTASVAYKEDGGKVSDARVVLGHVAPVPWSASDAAKALNGKAVDAESGAAAGEAAQKGASPLSQNAYKVALVKTAVKRAALAAAGKEA